MTPWAAAHQAPPSMGFSRQKYWSGVPLPSPIMTYRYFNSSMSWTRDNCGAFELWCWRKLLGVPWTARRSNQSILEEISPDYSLEGLMLKLQYLATWCEEMTHSKRPWSWERLKAKGKEGKRGGPGLDSITNSMNMSLSKLQETVKEREAWRAAIHGVIKSRTWLSDWTKHTRHCSKTFTNNNTLNPCSHPIK